MPRVLVVVVDAAAGGGFGPAQWLALAGVALLSVCVVVFLCGSSSAKGGSGKAPAQEMADRSAAAASTTRQGCEEAPVPVTASRGAATASSASTSGGGDLERGRRGCCVCAGWPDCGPCPCGGPCYGGFGTEGVDFSSCCCCCDGCDCGGLDCSGVDCSGVDCGVCVDCVGGCCGACMMFLASC